ncbi:MAG: hypothetical protein WCJ49_00075 [Deltaproteobacteria bacterium]
MQLLQCLLDSRFHGNDRENDIFAVVQESFLEGLKEKMTEMDFPHSALGHLTPVEFEQKYKANHNLFHV